METSSQMLRIPKMSESHETVSYLHVAAINIVALYRAMELSVQSVQRFSLKVKCMVLLI